MKTIIHKANERGKANYGWLNANYSFSFANYYNNEKINFGALRVLNDDTIAAGMGFGTHPHDNMEIITIPLSGSLKHRDSLTNKWIPIETGEVQVMSAGTGVMHSEMNNSPVEPVQLFQIWIIPNKENVPPQYSQKKFDAAHRKNVFQTLVSSIDSKNENTLKIHQKARISRIDLTANNSAIYEFENVNNGVYILVISGEVLIGEQMLTTRDAIGIYNINEIAITAEKNSELLLIEVPMNF
jgi:redox-sensitive bicupin YhaK (pirin superfamily)